MSSPALLPSPLTLMRRRAGLDMVEAAGIIGLSTLCVARVEKFTQRIPAGVLRKWQQLLIPPAAEETQMTIFDLIATHGDGSEGEGPYVL